MHQLEQDIGRLALVEQQFLRRHRVVLVVRQCVAAARVQMPPGTERLEVEGARGRSWTGLPVRAAARTWASTPAQ
ncbi:hypothetical protein OG413_40195 [Streptomyces sp. NBC_01433]|uniref:hypothetical protein n=1 Tax=Streptomyces sp. NBC_01433 TaxID=2903864 RepID=UPI002253F153|nr:hypothetical protein [Streptomyces sp. NBC_01433]MCX4681421.1 hypothetical protein [Streptomyces sp. NBC_01433]